MKALGCQVKPLTISRTKSQSMILYNSQEPHGFTKDFQKPVN